MDAGAGGRTHPTDDSWVAAVHASETDDSPLGCGIVIDEYRILTCAHVAGRKVQTGSSLAWTANASIWVAFPKAEEGGFCRRLRVDNVVFPTDSGKARDLAVLYLPEPVPGGVAPAPLRCPKSADLVSQRWWAFGFPYEDDPMGDAADGIVGASLGYGWIRLDTASRYPVKRGFSGSGLWSPDYHAVVAVVGQARGDKGDGRAITLYQADEWFPDEKIWSLAGQWSAPQAGEVAMAAWGWSLSSDQEATRHWRPRGRGVSIGAERGYRFRGRTTALEVIRDWLDRDEPDRRVLLVTGAPGTGKSAVLGRIVTTADADSVVQLPDSDTGIRATIGSVGCAVHAKGKTSLEVATEIARAASAALPERIEDFAAALHDALSKHGRRFNVIIDALDEADSPAEAQAIVTKVIMPMSETCTDVGAQVVVGSRRTDGDGDLLGAFGGAARLVDLDETEFFAEEDLATYALATLQLTGDERSGNPYSDDAVAGPVADQIAALSERNFLIAGLTARTHGLYDDTAVVPEALSFSAKVDDAMREYLRRIPPIAVGARTISAETLLTALAFAEAPGLPACLWRVALRALGAGDVPEAVLTGFARSAAASFLVESSGGDGEDSMFRLFHQALNDALLHARAVVARRPGDERALTSAFLKAGWRDGWERAPAYLLRSLPVHAAHAGLAGDLLADDAYLLHADLRRLLQAADGAVTLTPAGHDRAQLLRLTPQALDASPAGRAAMFSVTEALDNLGNAYRDDRWQATYRALWAVAAPRREQAACQGHQDEVNAVCAVEVDGRELLATASDDMTVGLWDPRTGEQVRVLRGHQGGIIAVCAVEVDGRDLLATASDDMTVGLWDPGTGEQVRVLEGHQGGVGAVCAVKVDGRDLLATGSIDKTVRLWDPGTGGQVRVLEGHQGRVWAVCAVKVDGRDLLATGSIDKTVRLWDPGTGEQVRVLRGHQGGVGAVCAVKVDDQDLLATASGGDRMVGLWDPGTGEQVRVLRGHQGGVGAVCAVKVDDQDLLATGSDGDGTVRLWDPGTGEQVRVLEGHQGGVWAVCAVELDGRELLATASGDETVRLWNLSDVEQTNTHRSHRGGVGAVCAVEVDGRELLATASDDMTVGLWDPRTGEQVRVLEGHQGGVGAVCAVKVDGRDLLATGSGGDRTVGLWDPGTGEQVRVLEGHQGGVGAVCAVKVDGRDLLATGSIDKTVRLWDPGTGGQVRVLEGHQGGVGAVCAVKVDGRDLLATGSIDKTVRLWDPGTGGQVRVLEGHQGRVWAVCAVKVDGRDLLATGSIDKTVRLWDPGTGGQVRVLEGHQGRVWAVCAVKVDDQDLLATASHDRTVRLWDPRTGIYLATVPTHHEALGLTAIIDSLAIGLDNGILVIRLKMVG